MAQFTRDENCTLFLRVDFEDDNYFGTLAKESRRLAKWLNSAADYLEAKEGRSK